MKQRDPLVATLLSLFVPFYILYWFYATAKDMQAKGAKVPNIVLLLAPAVAIGLFMILLFSSAALGSSSKAAGNGTAIGGSVLFLIGLPVSMVLTLMYYYKFGAAVEQVTNKAVTKGLLFVLFWFVAPAGVFISQEKLNQVGGAQPNVASAPNPVDGSAPTPPQPPVPPVTPPTPPSNPVS